MDQLLANSLTRPRLYAVLLGLFAAVAAALAALGISGDGFRGDATRP